MSKLGNVSDLVTTRLDTWYNALTGLGNALRDKAQSTQFIRSYRLPDETLENLYHDEDMAARICEALPEEALRKGYYISVENESDSDLPSQVREHEKRLKFTKALGEAAIWSRVFGGAVIYLGIEDGQAEDQPVKEEAIKSIRFVLVLDKRSLQVQSLYDDPENDLKFGEPKTYQIQATVNKEPCTIHESRLLRLDGALTSQRRKDANGGWSESVLQKVHDTLVQFSTGWQSTGHLLTDAAQGVFKLKGLVDMIAGGDCDILQSRMEVVEMGRSVARAIMLDADSEDFERQAYNFAGVPDVLKAFILRLAAAARMPVMVLMGQSPSGLNATGDNDIRLWYDRVQAYQTEDLEPLVVRFLELLFASQDFDGEAPEAWEVKWERLWQVTDVEQATLEKATAEKDKIYIDSGVLLPEEVALNRFKARGFSTDTQIDLDARQEMLDLEIELAKDKAGEEPEPPPMMPDPTDSPEE